MIKRVSLAWVRLWDRPIGAVAWDAERALATFEYDREFLNDKLDVAPLHMPIDDALRGDGIYAFPALDRDTYMGLPGLLADALPDKFGHRIIDALQQGMKVDGRELRIGASIGVAVYPPLEGDIDALMNRADQAMYAAKRAGKGRLHYAQTS